jgi:branched-chain amino acid transport system ATP-binding protein
MLITTKGLSKTFGGLKAVTDVNFSLNRGELRALIGPNGAGKTTLVSLLSGRLSPTAGSITFDGKDIARMPAWKRVRLGIAYTFQITSIFPQLTVYENVATAARYSQSVNRNTDSLVTECLFNVGIEDRSLVKAAELSYGHQRLLEVAMGCSLKPKLMILDEPTQGLADSEIENFCELLEQINKHTTILLIEHNMSVVMQLARKISVLDHGRIIAEGTPDEISNNSLVQTAYLGS